MMAPHHSTTPEDIMDHPTHPLVEKAVRGWLKLAADYGVETSVRRGESSWDPTAVYIRFEGSSTLDCGGIWIFAPFTKGSRPRQAPIVYTHYRGRGGKMKYGSKPDTKLQTLRDRIIWSWSPTARARLEASLARTAVAA
jgi:hypothetical protein